MRHVTHKGLFTVAAAGGVLALSAGVAHADPDATGTASDSPGLLSGNNVQLPIGIPVNACGNTVNVVGLGNAAFGNACVNDTGDEDGSGHHDARGDGGADASGVAADSPGVASGNNIQAPIEVPVNACGNTVDLVGLGNGAFGNDCANGGDHKPPEQDAPRPDEPERPAPPEEPRPGGGGQAEEEPAPDTGASSVSRPAQPAADTPSEETLAHTGAPSAVTAAVPLGAGLLVGGVVLYRRRARLVR